MVRPFVKPGIDFRAVHIRRNTIAHHKALWHTPSELTHQDRADTYVRMTLGINQDAHVRVAGGEGTHLGVSATTIATCMAPCECEPPLDCQSDKPHVGVSMNQKATPLSVYPHRPGSSCRSHTNHPTEGEQMETPLCPSLATPATMQARPRRRNPTGA